MPNILDQEGNHTSNKNLISSLIEYKKVNNYRDLLQESIVLNGRYWKELHIFLAVSKVKSFSKASKIIGESVPTISRSIKRLEDVLKIKLIKIGATGAFPTEVGYRIASEIAEFDYRLFSYISNIKKTELEINGTVKLTAPESISSIFIAAAINDFSGNYPNIKINLKDPRDDSDLHCEYADIDIAFFPSESEEIISGSIGYMNMMPMASRSYLDKYGIPNRENILDHIFIDNDDYRDPRFFMEWNSVIQRSKNVNNCDSNMAYRASIKSGLGIGLLPTFFFDDENFIVVDLGVRLSIEMHARVLSKKISEYAVAAVYEWIPEIFNEKLPWFSKNQDFTELRHSVLGRELNVAKLD